jgi:drug/metabolite transporter, DME family
MASSAKKVAHPIRGYLFIAAATFCWGISAAMGRAVFTGRLHLGAGALQPIDPLILAQSRTTISLVVLLPILLLKRGAKSLRTPWNDLLRCSVLGVLGVAASNYFYYLAIQKTTVATAIILQYTAPAMVLVWMLLRGVQNASLPRVAGVMLAVAGSVFAIGAVSARATFPWLWVSRESLRFNTVGVVAALIAAVSFSFYNIYARGVILRLDRWRVLLYALMGAALCWLVVNSPAKVIAAHYSREQWLFLTVFALSSVLIPFSLYFTGLEYLDPTRAIVTSCLEPVFAILIAALTLGEKVGPLQVTGILVVLAATVLVQLPERDTGKSALVEPIE